LTEMRCRMCSKEGALGRALMIGWVLTTVGFLLACAFWKGELFTGESRPSLAPEQNESSE
jgi:hypothetical protein